MRRYLLLVLIFWKTTMLAAQPQSALQELLGTKGLEHAIVGISIKQVTDGKELVGHNARISMTPASVAKLLPTWFSLQEKGADYRYQTKVCYTGTICNGTLAGNIVIESGGDPTCNSRYFPRHDLLANIEAGNISVIDVISSWNSEYNQNDSKKRIIPFIIAKYDSLDDNGKKEVKEHVLDPLVTALKNKANKLILELDGEDSSKLKTAKNALENAYTATTIGTDLATAFDNLYLATRWAAIKVIAKDAEEYYGAIDNEVFNNKLFEDETINDLKAEGFSDEQINAQKINYRPIEHNTPAAGNSAGSNNDTRPMEERISDYANKLNEDHRIEIGKKEYDVYQETKDTGRGYKRLFIIIDGELYELPNTKLEDGNFKTIDEDLSSAPRKIELSSIASDYNQTIEAENETKKNKVAQQDLEKHRADAEYAGKEVTICLCRKTNKSDNETVAKALSSIKQDTVLEFLDGVYENTYVTNSSKGKYQIEGFIEKCWDDNCSGKVTADGLKNFINLFLARAKEMGYGDSPEYKAIDCVLNKFMDINIGRDFDTHIGCSRRENINDSIDKNENTINGHLWGTTVSEALDCLIEKLYIKIRADHPAD